MSIPAGGIWDVASIVSPWNWKTCGSWFPVLSSQIASLWHNHATWYCCQVSNKCGFSFQHNMASFHLKPHVFPHKPCIFSTLHEFRWPNPKQNFFVGLVTSDSWAYHRNRLSPRSLPNWMRYSAHSAVIQPQAWIRPVPCCDLCGKHAENSWISCIQNHLKMKYDTNDTILSAEISPKRLCLKSNWIWKGFKEMVQLDFLTGELNDWIDRRINRPLRDCTC